jgi:hypothetical protein
MSRLCLIIATLTIADAAHAHGGEPHLTPGPADLLGPSTSGEQPATTARTTFALPDVPSDALGAVARPDAEAAWAEQAGRGLGHLTSPERGLVGTRLADDTAHLLFAVEGTPDAEATSGFSHLGVTLLGRESRRFVWGVGQLVFNDNALAQTESIGLNIGFIRYHERLRLGSMRLELDAHLTANLFQQTESDSPLLRGLRDGIRPCSTQSEIGLRLTLHVSRELALMAFAIDQDDPFHFVSGAECLGDGAVWMQSSKAGLALDAKLGRGLVLSAGLTWATAAVGYDLEAHRHGVAVAGDFRNTNVEAGLTLAYRR